MNGKIFKCLLFGRYTVDHLFSLSILSPWAILTKAVVSFDGALMTGPGV